MYEIFREFKKEDSNVEEEEGNSITTYKYQRANLTLVACEKSYLTFNELSDDQLQHSVLISKIQ